MRKYNCMRMYLQVSRVHAQPCIRPRDELHPIRVGEWVSEWVSQWMGESVGGWRDGCLISEGMSKYVNERVGQWVCE